MMAKYRNPAKLLTVYRTIGAFRETELDSPSLREIIARLPNEDGMPKDPSVLSYLLDRMAELNMIELVKRDGRLRSIRLLDLKHADESVRKLL
jgi:hypothetical protein